jgi:hypothetical protein
MFGLAMRYSHASTVYHHHTAMGALKKVIYSQAFQRVLFKAGALKRSSIARPFKGYFSKRAL